MSRASTATPKRQPDGTWSFRLDLGPGYDRHGRYRQRRQARRRGFATAREAQAALDELRGQVREGTTVTPSALTLGEYLTTWCSDTLPRTVAESTCNSYTAMMRSHVIPNLGAVQLRRLDAPMLDGLYRQLLEPGASRKSRDTALSPRTVRYVHTILRRALSEAVKAGLITRNPSDAATPPRAGRRNSTAAVKVWSAEDLASFLTRTEADDDRHAPLWRLLAASGMRRGEALGLQWVDLDTEAGTVAIVRTVTSSNGQLAVGEPKTSAGSRTIALDRDTLGALRRHRARRAEERLALGAGPSTPTDWVFAEPLGEVLSPTRVSGAFTRRAQSYGLPHIGVHGLRHTWATLALRSGVHPKVVQQRLGHSSVLVTLDTYSHVTEGMDAAAAQTVADVIAGACDQSVSSAPLIEATGSPGPLGDMGSRAVGLDK